MLSKGRIGAATPLVAEVDACDARVMTAQHLTLNWLRRY